MSEPWSSPLQDSESSFEFSSATAQRSDSELCAQIRQSSPNSPAGRAAFGELYARHRLPALHVALRLNRDRSRAEDSVSEAFAKIWQAWGNGTGPNDSFKSYLMAAVRSESYRRKATTRATAVVEPDVLSFLAGPELLDYADEAAERDQLGRAFKALPDSWQSAITMIDVDGVPVSAAAEVMELSPNSFNSLLRRAREGLRVAYLQEYVAPGRPECAEYSADLARYVRGRLGSRRVKSLEAHLSRCNDCDPQVARLRDLNTTFQAWMTPAVIAAALIKIEHFPTSAVPAADGSIWTLVLGSSSGEGTGPGAVGAGTGTNVGPWVTAAPADTTTGVGASASGSSVGGLAGGTATIKVTLACIAAAATIVATTAGIVAMQNESAPQPPSAAGNSDVPVTASTPTTEPVRDDGVPEPRPSAAQSKNHGPQNDKPSAQASPRDPSSPEKPVDVPPTESEQPPQSADADDHAADSDEVHPEPNTAPLPQPGPESDSAADRQQEPPVGAEEPTAPSEELANATDSKATSETDSAGRPNGDDGEASTEKPNPDGEPNPGDESESHEDESEPGEESPSPSEKPNPGGEEPGSDDTATGSNDDDEGIHCHDFGRWYYCH